MRLVTLAAASLVIANAGYAQSDHRFALRTVLGPSLPLDAAAAFDPGTEVGLKLSMRLDERVRLRLLVEGHEHRFDRRRFLTNLGRTPENLSGSLGAGSMAILVTAGVDWSPWTGRAIRPYAGAGFGLLKREAGSSSLYVFMYCSPPAAVISRDPETGRTVISVPVDWVPHDFCAQAKDETAVAGSELAVEGAVGFETELPVGGDVTMEVGFVQGLESVGARFIPVRVGWIFRF